MFKINGVSIGKGRTYVIAEAGINHNGSVDTALKLVKAAKDAGADAVKFQSFRAEFMCDIDLQETKDVEAITGGTKSSYDLYKALELSDAAHREIFSYARKIGMTCFSSVFDPTGIDILKKVNSPAIKISSGDLLYLPLIQKAIRTRKPLLISTGCATFSEVLYAYEQISRMTRDFALLHCVSKYPLPAEEANLKIIPLWKQMLPCPVGFSDHSEGFALAPMAVALGADIIEKHFTLDNRMKGPDHVLSLNPDHFGSMVDTIRTVEKALGNPYKMPVSSEWMERMNGRRGLKAARNLEAGKKIREQDIKVIKPATGLCPEKLPWVLGKKIKCDVLRGTPLEEGMFF